MRTIVVGVDGSPESQHALGVAAELARAVGGQVVAVHARGLLERWAAGSADAPASATDALREQFEQEWCRLLDDTGTSSVRMLREGAPVVVLLEVAREVSADIVVVGRRGAGPGRASTTLGSTSALVVEEADRPVLMVPTPTDPPPSAPA